MNPLTTIVASDPAARLKVGGNSYAIDGAIPVKIGNETRYCPLYGGEAAENPVVETGGPSARLPMRSDNWYYPGTEDFQDFELAANTLFTVPIFIPNDVTVDKIAFSVKTLAADVQNARVGIYADDGGYPSTLVIGTDLISLDDGGTGLRESQVTQALTAGWYWLAFAATTVANAAAPAHVVGIAASTGSEISYNLGILKDQPTLLFHTDTSDQSVALEADNVNPTTALPTPFPAGAYPVTIEANQGTGGSQNAVAMAILIA